MKNKTLIGRLTVSWATVALFFFFGDRWLIGINSAVQSALLFVWLFAVILWCAFGVVEEADHLAELLAAASKAYPHALDCDHRGCVDWRNGAWRQVLSDTWPRYAVRGSDDRLERRRRALPTVRWVETAATSESLQLEFRITREPK